MPGPSMSRIQLVFLIQRPGGHSSHQLTVWSGVGGRPAPTQPWRGKEFDLALWRGMGCGLALLVGRAEWHHQITASPAGREGLVAWEEWVWPTPNSAPWEKEAWLSPSRREWGTATPQPRPAEGRGCGSVLGREGHSNVPTQLHGGREHGQALTLPCGVGLGCGLGPIQKWGEVWPGPVG